MTFNEWLWEITNSQTKISYIHCGRKIIYITLKKIDPLIYISDYRGKPERFLKVLLPKLKLHIWSIFQSILN